MSPRQSVAKIFIPVLMLISTAPGCRAQDPAPKAPASSGGLTIESPEPETSIEPGTPTLVNGTHSMPRDSHVWIFLRDIYGGYYLQNPPAELFEGRWEQTNTRPGTEIRYIIAVQVDDAGHRKLKSWVTRDPPRFGKIDADEVKGLPGYRELARVAITPSH